MIMVAISGPISVTVLVTGRNNSILHGKLMGLIMDHVLSQSRKGPQKLFSDHLNSVRITQDAKSVGGIEARLQWLLGCSYYRWIIHIQKLSPYLTLEYTQDIATEKRYLQFSTQRRTIMPHLLRNMQTDSLWHQSPPSLWTSTHSLHWKMNGSNPILSPLLILH